MCLFQCTGRLKLTENNIVFKNVKTGKVEQLTSSDMEFVNWQKLVGTCAIRIFLKNGNLHRYSGFSESVSFTYMVYGTNEKLTFHSFHRIKKKSQSILKTHITWICWKKNCLLKVGIGVVLNLMDQY